MSKNRGLVIPIEKLPPRYASLSSQGYKYVVAVTEPDKKSYVGQPLVLRHDFKDTPTGKVYARHSHGSIGYRRLLQKVDDALERAGNRPLMCSPRFTGQISVDRKTYEGVCVSGFDSWDTYPLEWFYIPTKIIYKEEKRQILLDAGKITLLESFLDLKEGEALHYVGNNFVTNGKETVYLDMDYFKKIIKIEES